MSQSRIPRNYTDLIPLELIKMIFENIGNDLIAHVTFSKLRPDIYEYCYKGRGKTFWQPMLRQCGISTKHLVGYDEVADDCAGEWEELAFKCVEHADACKHSKCGIARLKENERFMKKSVERGASLLEAIVPSSGFHDTLMDIVPTTICSSITFQPNNPGKKLDDWTTSAFVRADGPEGDRRLRYGDELIQHPVLWRSFLTFPPVTELRVYGGMTIEATNSNGVIVADLIDLILETDFNAVNAPRLELQNIRELTMNVKRSAGQTPHSAQIFPSGWSFEETLRELYTFRSWFTALRWTVRMSRDRGRVSLFWVFEPQTLPEDHSEYHSLIRPWSRVE